MQPETPEATHVNPHLYSSLLAALAGCVLIGCGEQAGTEYHGEPMLTLKGTVVMKNEHAPRDLVPALAFYTHTTEDQDGMYFQDSDVSGEFPANFTLSILHPPPDETLVEKEEGRSGGRSCLGFITAVPAQHAEYVDLPGERVDTSTTSECDAQGCVRETRWYIEETEQSYVERARCDLELQNCSVFETSGDPVLARNAYRYFAGFATRYAVVYLEKPMQKGRIVSLLGGEPLHAGYHVVQVQVRTPEEEVAAVECQSQAQDDALVLYEAEYGAYPDPEVVSQSEFQEAAERKGDLYESLIFERGCVARSYTTTRIADPANHSLTVEIGADLRHPLEND
jgi:hypothetical protein